MVLSLSKDFITNTDAFMMSLLTYYQDSLKHTGIHVSISNVRQYYSGKHLIMVLIKNIGHIGFIFLNAS